MTGRGTGTKSPRKAHLKDRKGSLGRLDSSE